MNEKRENSSLFISKLKNKYAELYVKLSLKHIYGSEKIVLGDNDCAVCCLLKNGDFYIKSFINHYLSMGFKRIFFLDNNSDDKTVEIAKQYENVSVYSTNASVGKYQRVIKKIFALETITGGWCLDVDIDEFFDYPNSSCVSIADFLAYLNLGNYTTVVTQMLDMFSNKCLSYLQKKREENIKETYIYYDISSIEKQDYLNSELVKKYAPHNILSNRNIQLYAGGIRKSLYGINCLLTKHSLFKLDNKISIFPHAHFVDMANIADVSAVLFHYKLTSGALETSVQNRDSFFTNSKGYNDFINLIKNNKDFVIVNDNSKKLMAINDLLNNGFLVEPDRYNAYAEALKSSSS